VSDKDKVILYELALRSIANGESLSHDDMEKIAKNALYLGGIKT